MEYVLQRKINSIEIIEEETGDFKINNKFAIELISGLDYWIENGKSAGYNYSKNIYFNTSPQCTHFNWLQNSNNLLMCANPLFYEEKIVSESWKFINELIVYYHKKYSDKNIVYWLQNKNFLKKEIRNKCKDWLENMIINNDYHDLFAPAVHEGIHNLKKLNYWNEQELTDFIDQLFLYFCDKNQYYEQAPAIRHAMIDKNQFLKTLNKFFEKQCNADYLVFINSSPMDLDLETFTKLNELWNRAWINKPRGILIIPSYTSTKAPWYLGPKSNSLQIGFIPT